MMDFPIDGIKELGLVVRLDEDKMDNEAEVTVDGYRRLLLPDYAVRVRGGRVELALDITFGPVVAPIVCDGYGLFVGGHLFYYEYLVATTTLDPGDTLAVAGHVLVYDLMEAADDKQSNKQTPEASGQD